MAGVRIKGLKSQFIFHSYAVWIIYKMKKKKIIYVLIEVQC